MDVPMKEKLSKKSKICIFKVIFSWGSSKKEEYAIRMLIQTNIERLMIDEYTK
jgi:hypothetical protein